MNVLMVKYNKMKRESLETIYQDGDPLLGKYEEQYYLFNGEQSCRLSDYPDEPCLYIKAAPGIFITIHHSFTLDELCRAAKTNGTIKMITGDEYDMQGICMLLRKTLTLSMESVDIGYLEGCCFMDYLKECGATSEETAVPLSDRGIYEPNVMYPFLQSEQVSRTNDARYYIVKSPEKGRTDMPADTSRFLRVISNQVRFGCGYREVNGKRQYFAWHGFPNRNDDNITISEISQTEFDMISKEYPQELDADRETAELFRNKYVEGHPIILEGWNKLP